MWICRLGSSSGTVRRQHDCRRVSSEPLSGRHAPGIQRVSARAGTTRIIVPDLNTGASTDLLNAFQVPTIMPSDPTSTGPPAVVMGRPLAGSARD
jgi:hypothetical protein